MPDTMPDVPTVATSVLLLSQVPPVGVDVSDVVLPSQRLAIPEIAVGTAFTVTICVLRQPLANE